ncbi:hypothetical protein [Arthrobacter woluwensis]|uniref:hypothetical protein n=1 Tax=Arthrobacter woluwensis TaxID=156980 RepID=UPI0015E77A79|nr:hypothetical protein [Arthrobacter woluwensis]
MKVPPSIRAKHEEHTEICERVEARAKSLITNEIDSKWHFEGRCKTLESYAQKIETGRFDADDLQDFFACTIVVPTMNHLSEAETIVADLFDVKSRKPETNKTALGTATSFPFDHIRLYVQHRETPGQPTGPIHEVTFEIQIKTYLQHAWSIATHDLTYKTSNLSWGKERVASQVKATLEAAEIAIVEAERLADSGNILLSRADSDTLVTANIASILQRNFTETQLPEDIKRLSNNLKNLLAACGLESAELEKIIHIGKTKNGNSHPENLSPYGIVIFYLIELHSTKLKRALSRKEGDSIFVPPEIKLPASFGSKLPRLRTL